MCIDKRKLLWTLTEKGLWKDLSPEEIRSYLLLIVFADISNGEGKLSWKDLNYYLGPHFHREMLIRAAQNLERLHLVRMKFSLDKLEIEYKILSEEN